MYCCSWTEEPTDALLFWAEKLRDAFLLMGWRTLRCTFAIGLKNVKMHSYSLALDLRDVVLLQGERRACSMPHFRHQRGVRPRHPSLQVATSTGWQKRRKTNICWGTFSDWFQSWISKHAVKAFLHLLLSSWPDFFTTQALNLVPKL